MKKKKFFAVAVIMMTLCAAFTFSSCKDENHYGDDEEQAITPVKKKPQLLLCGVNRLDYTTSGVVQTRADYGIPEGILDITSYHKASWLLGKDTINHAYTGRFVAKFFDVKRTRYAHNIDIFKNPVMSPTYLGDSVLWKVSFKDTETHDFDITILELPGVYENDTHQVGDSLMKLCLNNWATRELIDAKVKETTSTDENYNAYSVDLYFQFGLEEGPDNKKTCMVTLPLILVPKGGPDVPIPDDKHDVVAFEEANKGYDLVNDSVNNRWIDLVKVLSNGTREPFPRVAFVSKNRLFAPERQIKNVTDFDYQSQTMKKFDATPKGDWEKRENNIYVLPTTQTCVTYTDKGNCVFVGDFDGQAYFIDSLGVKHYFLYKEYDFEDDGWGRSDLTPTDNLERKLLKSDIRGLFNGATLPRTGEIELRKVKDSKVPIGPWYSPLDSDESGLKYVSEGVYETFRTKYLLFSDNTKELVGKVSIPLYLRATAPNKQTITVTDWNIQDITAQAFDPRRQTARKDTTANGVALVTPYTADYKTRTNKSTSSFTYTYDGKVVLIDPDTKEEVEFLALAVSPEDLGGVRTLHDLMEQNDFERKAMTTSIKVTETHTNTSITKEAEVEFQKAVEKEELLNWRVEQSLIPAGNGLWTSTPTIVFNYKLAGEKRTSIPLTLDWSIKGEAKSQVKLNEASAPYVTIDEGTWGSATTSNPQAGVTVYTSKKTVTENYTNLTDKYTATMQTAKYNNVVDGKTIAFDFLTPTSMSVAHKDGNLVNGNRTATVDGVNYDVWNHTGSVTATVTSASNGSQTQDAIDEKEVLVQHIVIPEHPEWGAVDRLGGASLAYHKDIGDNMQGAFHKVMAIYFEKGILIVHTNSWGPSAYDFTYDENDFYYYGSTYRGVTLPQTVKVNSAILRDGRWEPALITQDGSGWTYVGLDGFTVNMSQNLAITANIKNFNSETTAANNPFLAYTGQRSGDLLNVYTNKGALVFSIK